MPQHLENSDSVFSNTDINEKFWLWFLSAGKTFHAAASEETMHDEVQNLLLLVNTYIKIFAHCLLIALKDSDYLIHAWFFFLCWNNLIPQQTQLQAPLLPAIKKKKRKKKETIAADNWDFFFF